MKKFSLILLLAFAIISALNSCDKDDSNNSETSEIQVLSTSPTDGETDVPSGTNQAEITYNQDISYSVINGSVTVNGEKASFSKEGNNKLKITGFTVKPGNTYKIVVTAGTVVGYDKEFTFSFSGKTITTSGEIKTTAINSSNTNVQKVYEFLYQNYGKKIISGAMATNTLPQAEADLVKEATGKYPAMLTFDFIFSNLTSERSSWEQASIYQKDENIAIYENHWKAGGIVSACWHLNAPPSELAAAYNQVNNSDISWNAKTDGFSAANATKDGCWEKEFLDFSLEIVAKDLKIYKDKDIPVVWRPFHEAAGHNGNYNQYGWFWWGKSGAEAYVKLWKYMFDYFKNKGLDNLIWVWNTQYSNTTPLDYDWYPGNDYVDIVACDIYEKTAAECAEQYALLTEIWSDKIIALSENGSIGNISQIWNEGGTFSYFMPWYTYDESNSGGILTDLNKSIHAKTAWWEDAANCENVIFREDMPGW